VEEAARAEGTRAEEGGDNRERERGRGKSNCSILFLIR
jgi:hypothetical protein